MFLLIGLIILIMSLNILTNFHFVSLILTISILLRLLWILILDWRITRLSLWHISRSSILLLWHIWIWIYSPWLSVCWLRRHHSRLNHTILTLWHIWIWIHYPWLPIYWLWMHHSRLNERLRWRHIVRIYSRLSKVLWIVEVLGLIVMRIILRWRVIIVMMFGCYYFMFINFIIIFRFSSISVNHWTYDKTNAA